MHIALTLHYNFLITEQTPNQGLPSCTIFVLIQTFKSAIVAFGPSDGVATAWNIQNNDFNTSENINKSLKSQKCL